MIALMAVHYSKNAWVKVWDLAHWQNTRLIFQRSRVQAGNTKGGSITVLLTTCLTVLDLSVLLIKNKYCQLSYSWFQTSQTGGQWYSDTSPFSIPCIFFQILSVNSLSKLERLSIMKCKDVTVAGIEMLTESCENLKVLKDIEWFAGVSKQVWTG